MAPALCWGTPHRREAMRDFSRFCSAQHGAKSYPRVSAFRACSRRCRELVGCPVWSSARGQSAPPRGMGKPGGNVLRLAPRISRAAQKRSGAKTQRAQIHPLIHPCVSEGKESRDRQEPVGVIRGQRGFQTQQKLEQPRCPATAPPEKPPGFSAALALSSIWVCPSWNSDCWPRDPGLRWPSRHLCTRA